ncbi:DNA repair exonuclease SbcCD, D subunit, putative [Syntrophotalea carbinolica DSM 2380]|uniref:DNA repair exonuclease SbcCD, D subunit, putative n=1 Tax=Syntrophotalea carbinolica (strain DSM 2380 / NBRC 103641 / GraBd1) TaxID=338963 RepID=Q3A5P7_SYNC1|nr:DNA repair exonuclease [Syntrophotalea carbinolica]ABA88310.1 DNA repair exonuclease SbcCD, D subunit, putative [Syntrophotalea carbinolica DSM 2380]
MIRILHTADIHLGAVFAELAECAAARRNDQLYAFERMVELAIDRKVHLLVVAGDLFASPWPTTDLVSHVRAGFQRLCDNGILPVVLPGQNDMPRSPDGVYARGVFDGVLVLDPQQAESVTLDIDGQPLHLHSGRIEDDRAVWPAAVSAAADGVHVGLLYLPAKTGLDIDIARWCDSAWWQESGASYLALGGVHNFCEWRKDERLLACCPGTPEGLTFGENGERCCVLASVDAASVSVERFAVNKRTLSEVCLDLSDCRCHDEVLQRILSFGSPDGMVHLTLTGQPAAVLDGALLQQQAAEAFYYLEIDDRSMLLGSPLAETLARKDDLSGLLVRNAQALAVRRSDENQLLLDAAVREILLRRQALGGGAS